MAKSHVAKILSIWQTAWEQTNKRNPLSVTIDNALAKHGYSIVDVMSYIGLITAKQPPSRTKDERDLLTFFARAKMVAESALVDTVSESVVGSVFVLKTRHGYTETQKIEQTSKTTVVMEYGSDEPS